MYSRGLSTVHVLCTIVYMNCVQYVHESCTVAPCTNMCDNDLQDPKDTLKDSKDRKPGLNLEEPSVKVFTKFGGRLRGTAERKT